MVWILNASPEVDASSQYPMIIAVSTIITVLSIAIVSTRLWIRQTTRGLAADDHLAIVSMTFCTAYAAICIAQTRYGLGLPIATRPDANLATYTIVNFAGRPIYQVGISFFKCALLISYLRLLEGTAQKAYRMTVWAILGLVFASHLGCALALIFACDPVNKSWDPYVEGTCLAPGPSFTGYAVVTIISDVAVALVPVPVLLRLNIKNEKKVALIGIFALGLFTTLCSIFRYLEISRIQSGDGDSTMLVLWGVVEFNVGNIVSSLPFLAPVFWKKAKGYRSKMSGGSNGYGSSNGRTRSRAFKNGDVYKLSEVGHDKGAFATSSTTKSGSEENILQGNGQKGHTILKSVTYTVQVDEESGEKRKSPDEGFHAV